MSAATLLLPTQAHAAFSNCPYGTLYGSGRACLWDEAAMTGNPDKTFVAGSTSGFTFRSRAFANRTSNGCAVFYINGSTSVATAGPNTGNSWGGGHRDINHVFTYSTPCF